MKRLIIFFIILVGLACVYFIFSRQSFVHLTLPNSAVIKAKVVLTMREREAGLSGLKEMNGFDAMLFVQDTQQKVAFWMHGMLFPLDIIYLDENKIVEQMFFDKQPCVNQCENLFSFSDKIKYVIELKSGDIEKNKLKIGDKIIWAGY